MKETPEDEEILQFLNNLADYCIPMDGGKMRMRSQVWAIVKARDAQIRQESKWISVKKQLPRVCDICLCLTHSNDHRQVVCKFYDKDFYDEAGLLRDITHWMPLPEPPVGKEGEE